METLDKFKNLVSSTLRNTDHVHYSEFLSENDKKDIMEQRKLIWMKYENIKNFISENKKDEISIYLDNLELCLNRGDSLDEIFKCFEIKDEE